MNTDRHRLNRTVRQGRRDACDTVAVPQVIAAKASNLRLPPQHQFFRTQALQCKVLFSNRSVLLSAWSTLVAFLFIFPGFEIRSLVMGLIIGYWPTLFFAPLYECQFQHPFILLSFMVFLSGATVLFCAWLMDKGKIGKGIGPLLAISMIMGAVYFATHSISYESWKRTPVISAAMESPEISYQPSRRDFNQTIIIPRSIVGSLWGLYLTAGIGGLCSSVIILKKHYRIVRKTTPQLRRSPWKKK